MKQVLVWLFCIIFVTSLISLLSVLWQVDHEERRLIQTIEHRGEIVVQSFKKEHEAHIRDTHTIALKDTFKSISEQENLYGIGVYDEQGNPIAQTDSLSLHTLLLKPLVTSSLNTNTSVGKFIQLYGERIYVSVEPLHTGKTIAGAILVVQHAGYIDSQLFEIWQNNLMRLAFQIVVLSITAVVMFRFLIFKPIQRLVKSIELARVGNVDDDIGHVARSSLFTPLVTEVAKIKKNLITARLSAIEEARLRISKIDSPWTAQRLKEFVKETIQDRMFVVVSNREPYIHTKKSGVIAWYQPASGMVTALEPIMQACGGMWIATGSGDADRETVDAHDTLSVPPDEPAYKLRRVWLTPQEERGYYDGFSNEGMWPLCHIAHTRPIFRESDWNTYKKVNAMFADRIVEEIKHAENPIVMVQDFHLALVPLLVKRRRPDCAIAIFWHIPWPNAESFSICPWKNEILEGLLGADLLGFHTQLHCNNFIDSVGKGLEALVDYEQFSVTKSDHLSIVRPFPISIAFSHDEVKRTQSEARALREKLMKQTGITSKYIGVGVDRLDYTKGILERFKAIEIFLKANPHFVEHFTFVQIGAPSRTDILRYQEFDREVVQEVERINTIFKTRTWKPIVLIMRHFDHEEINNWYSIANVCLVTSLHDGMNLVSKEFIASRSDEQGVLILSQFAGAARELTDALIVNPYNAVETAEAIHTALRMSVVQQQRRMKRLRSAVKNHNIYRWSADLIKTIANVGETV